MARFWIFLLVVSCLELLAASPLGDYGPSGVPTQNPIPKERLPELTKAMKLIPARDTSFMMGFTGKIGGDSHSKPSFKVHFSYDFYMDSTEVTVKQFQEVYQYAWDHGLIRVDSAFTIRADGQRIFGGGFGIRSTRDTTKWLLYTNRGLELNLESKKIIIKGNPYFPMGPVSWYGAVFFCYIKNIMNGLEPVVDLNTWTLDFSKNGYRLPTEAEWEFTARAFAPNYLHEFEDDPAIKKYRRLKYPFGSQEMIEIVNRVARSHAPYVYSSRYIHQKVGLVKPNIWGVYDLRGNAAEIMLDTFFPFDKTEKKDPVVVGKNLRPMFTSTIEKDKQDWVVLKPSGSISMPGFVTLGWGYRASQVRSSTTNRNSFRTVLPVK